MSIVINEIAPCKEYSWGAYLVRIPKKRAVIVVPTLSLKLWIAANDSCLKDQVIKQAAFTAHKRKWKKITAMRGNFNRGNYYDYINFHHPQSHILSDLIGNNHGHHHYTR